MEKKTSSPTEEHLSLHMAPSRLHNFVFPATASWDVPRSSRFRKQPTVNCGESGASIKEASSSTSEVIQSILSKKPEDDELPWNLRRRRAFSKGESSKSAALREEKRKLTVPLSLKDVEADFLLMTGKKPHKRPKKRPRHVQKQVDAFFPGLRLSEVTFNMYKVVK